MDSQDKNGDVADSSSAPGQDGIREARILIIEDEGMQRALIGRISSAVGFVATVARTFEEAAALLRAQKFDCITLDLSLGGEHGITAGLRLLEELKCQAPIVIVSGAASTQLQKMASIGRAHKLNIVETIPKPIDPAMLRKTLARLKAKIA
jgi:DNA-binding response OmpR family regulator